MLFSTNFMSFFYMPAVLISLSAALTIPLPVDIAARQASNLKQGSWLITYQPSAANSPLYKGPMRITSNDTSLIISGDLYNGTVEPNPADGSPLLPRANYWSYIRFVKYTPSSNGAFSLGMDFYLYNGVPNPRNNYTDWSDDPLDGGYTVDLQPATPPTTFPSSTTYFSGTVKRSSTGASLGTFTMGWVSPFYRRFHLERAAVTGMQRPSTDTTGTRTWASIFASAGIDMTVEDGKADIPNTSDGMWSMEQAHAAMLQYRRATDFDTEWRIWLLNVPRSSDVARGAMIDGGREFNGVPREGCVVANEWIVGTLADGSPDPGGFDIEHRPWKWPETVTGRKFVELQDAWFRTNLHEVGHFFNLPHPGDFAGGMMDDTPTYAMVGETGVTAKRFPENIDADSFKWNAYDMYVMAHRPDTHVRPGWHNFGGATNDQHPPSSTESLLG
ncbi:hypothetical protein EJ04DRAFT_604027 [Polyplosphaeria fusca]|uniref:Uncharacterized protein n=1 Tax=Polyplosphaeria fusca TaxID=682080 RepID=A0A9P4V335_9PLEO|nr:hypothetical protein EJ04DRAFT_604027 [Polyplosphaeria fusca]